MDTGRFEHFTLSILTEVIRPISYLDSYCYLKVRSGHMSPCVIIEGLGFSWEFAACFSDTTHSD